MLILLASKIQKSVVKNKNILPILARIKVVSCLLCGLLLCTGRVLIVDSLAVPPRRVEGTVVLVVVVVVVVVVVIVVAHLCRRRRRRRRR